MIDSARAGSQPDVVDGTAVASARRAVDVCSACTVFDPASFELLQGGRGAEHALQPLARVLTVTELDALVATDLDVMAATEDSAVTAPFVRALEVEGPTTIFDPPPQRIARGSGPRARPPTPAQLADSYEAAMRKLR